MKGFFKFEGQPGWDPYTGQAMGGGLMPRQQELQPQGQMMQPEPMPQPQPSMMPQQAPQQAQPPAQGPQLPSLGDAKDAYDQIKDGFAGPTYQEPPHVSNPAPNYTGADPYDPAHYQGTLTDAELPNNNPVTDPSNYQGTLTGTADTSNPVFNPDSYQGTLYDPSNPLGLTEAEWVTQQGLMNSGSLLQEGMGLASNAGLAGGLSDMGGVADEIVEQGGGMMDSAGGMMDSAGKFVAGAGIANGIYGLSQGSGGKGGADLAAGVGAYFVPGFGWVKAAFDVGMGIGSFARSQGRVHDYFHPYMRNQIEGANGSTVMNVGFKDSLDDAAEQGYSDDAFYKDNGQYDLHPNQIGGTRTMVEKDGAYYFIDDIAGYSGVESYDDYVLANGGSPYDNSMGVLGMGDDTRPSYDKQAEDIGLYSRTQYNSFVNDVFAHDVSVNGVNFESDFITGAQHGDYKGQDTMGTRAEPNISGLVKTGEMNRMMDNSQQFLDTSKYADYVRPELPNGDNYKPIPIDYDMMGL
ncbi:MAG: hypothetical protein DRP85_06485 [Candidatus Makaraimicrobium thalassicum]|nr:MAG: hypothetical protein DRP85_06485 [Candidatus Omnitrophota bacterium]